MRATADYPPRSDSASAGGGSNNPLRPSRGVRRLVTSVMRMADLQIRIWLTKAKITVARIAMFAALFAIALTLAILAVIFLFIGIFKLLIDVAGLAPVWAFLIMSGVTILVAGIFVAIGMALLRKPAHAKTHASAHDPPENEPSTKGAGV